MPLRLTISILVADVIKLDIGGHLTAPRLKVGDLHLTQELGLPGFSSRAAAGPTESEPFIGDRMSDCTKRVSAFTK